MPGTTFLLPEHEWALGLDLLLSPVIAPQSSMDPSQLPVFVVDARTGETFDELRLDWIPHPGHTINIGEERFTVLEKRHYYQLRSGKYQLHKVRAFVRPAPQGAPEWALEEGIGDREKSLVNGQWVIGDATCEFNARSPLVRCAINPLGPCTGCVDFAPIPST